MSRIPTVRPAPAATPAQEEKQKAQAAQRAMRDAIRGLATQRGWPFLKAALVQELMQAIETCSDSDVTALAVAMGKAKGIVSTIRIYEAHETPGT